MSQPLKSRDFGDFTLLDIKKVIDDDALLIIPVGATEQHGHHLPVDTGLDGLFGTSSRFSRAIFINGEDFYSVLSEELQDCL